MAGECEELIETRKLKLENGEEEIPLILRMNGAAGLEVRS